ncbi:related to GTPase-activating protein beta-chimerin [Ramularia collo-cygni]|uniref:Related to GTPase-activating protein beta-chimerin n=1 Tax=Ramularia collo-cygni TaxID=112498 RepID=A0A2D3UQ24_9PEZI|nr:related to GTPase-activating protein beta-chimerin [Ramularia collo-cygni]CZT15185.1 related to GTPase-activating protein beta-chimerin [Ramularia collo-cygni]
MAEPRDDSAPGSPMSSSGPNGINNGANVTNNGNSTTNGNSNPRTDEVLSSQIAVTTLLDRLKQSIASARDFAQFLKKRSNLEEEQAKGLKRLAQAQIDNIKRSDVRGGTYAQQLAEVLRVHERMADNGMQFALSLHQMHEDLDVLSANMERGRKQWKHDGLDAEKKASDAETAMQKAKAKYDSLAEDYDRARTGDSKGSRRIGLKGPKSAEQHEQDLLKKTQAADEDYQEKVRTAKSQREQLLRDLRPKAVRALQELINESDSALTLQLQKFATFNEKLLLGNGLAVTPLGDNAGTVGQRSLRDLVVDIDNNRDFHSYVGSFSGKVVRPSEIRYEQHPTLAPKTQQPRQPPAQQQQSAQSPLGQNPPTRDGEPPNPSNLTVHTGPSQPNSTNSRTGGYKAYSPTDNPSASAHSQAPAMSPVSSPYSPSQPQTSLPLRDNYSAAPPYPSHPSERAVDTHQQTTGTIPITHNPIPAQTSPAASSLHRVFGLSLDTLFARDQSAVPMIVFQCMQAIDLFGLEIEGIYRQSGTTSQVNRLRQAFDSLPPNHPSLDFRNPSNFGHDVNSVASLLKQFFRELPDPLFTRAQYDQFIDAARNDDVGMRRDALHQGINDLPDPNYATLRALVLHLGRVLGNERVTRMGSAQLAVCFAPTLMGGQIGGNVGDGSLQCRVVETILGNASAIFDED